MARRRPAPTPEPTQASPEAAPDTPQPKAVWLSDHLVGRRAETRDDLMLIEAVVESFRKSEAMVRQFAEEQLASGLTVTEINAFYCVERDLIGIVEDADGRIRMKVETRIVERTGDGA